MLFVILEQLTVMAIRDRRHVNKSKQTTSLSGFDVAPPIGEASRSRDLMFFIGNEEHQERYGPRPLGPRRNRWAACASRQSF